MFCNCAVLCAEKCAYARRYLTNASTRTQARNQHSFPASGPRSPPTCRSPTTHLSRGRVAVDPSVAAGELAAGGPLRARRWPLPPGHGNVGVGATAEVVHSVGFLFEEHLLVTAVQLTALLYYWSIRIAEQERPPHIGGEKRARRAGIASATQVRHRCCCRHRRVAPPVLTLGVITRKPLALLGLSLNSQLYLQIGLSLDCE